MQLGGQLEIVLYSPTPMSCYQSPVIQTVYLMVIYFKVVYLVILLEFYSIYPLPDQPNILVIKAELLNTSIFEIKTNRFVGPRKFNNEPLPSDLYTFQRYDAQLQRIIWNSGIDMSRKVQDLQGREIVIGLFTYKPFMLLDYVSRGVCTYVCTYIIYCIVFKLKGETTKGL